MSWATHLFAFVLVALMAVGVTLNPFLRWMYGEMVASLLRQMAAEPAVTMACVGALVGISAAAGQALDRNGWRATACAVVAVGCIGFLLAVA